MRISPPIRAAVLAMPLMGCAAPAKPAPVLSPTKTANGNDCAVIAAVAKEHYHFGPDNVPPPLWLDGGSSGWKPDCDWSRYGLSFPETYDPDAPDPDGRVRPWVQFDRPRYDGDGALIETGVMSGPLAGEGVECRVRSGFAGWTVSECLRTWAS